MSTLLEDTRYSLRALGRRPLYAIVTVLVFAIAIGANSTVFGVFNGLFLRAMPYPDGDRLVMVYDSYPNIGLENAGTAIPDYLERREQAASLEDLAIVTADARTLGRDGAPPELLQVARASPSLFNVLRVAPVAGRAFTDAEATLGNDRVAMLSHRLWSTRFGARPEAVGTDIRLDGVSARVIGVLPDGFGFPDRDADVYMPFAFTEPEMSDEARGHQFSISVGRLKPGATIEGLNTELNAIVHRNVAEGRLTSDTIEVEGFTGRAQSLRELTVGNLKPTLLMLQAIVLAVLLIACANVANFQLARITARRRELAVRAALGAAVYRLVRLVMVESLAIALLGAVGGWLLAVGGLELVRALGLDRANQGFEYTLDAAVLAFTFGAAVAAALIAGLPPVIALLRDDLTRAVHEAGRLGSGGRSANALRRALVVAQVGVSLALLVAAGVLTKSFYRLQSEGPGFDSANIWTAQVVLPRTRYPERESWARFQRQALAELRELPGVDSAGFTSILPFSGNNDQGSINIDGFVLPEGGSPPHAQHRSIDENYLPTLGISILAGRNFMATEPDPVVIVDENVAAKYWPDREALGQRLQRDRVGDELWHTVVGVVPAVKQASLAELPSKETIYWHYEQRPVTQGVFTLRTTLPPEQLMRPAEAVFEGLDAEVTLFDEQTMRTRLLRSLGPQRTPMVLTIVFAAVAFTLAVIGIYGVLTWAVTQRVGEIGVRMALGARAGDIVRMVLKEGGRLIALGLAFGIAGAIALGRAVASQIQNVSAVDPGVLAVAVLGLTSVALLASWLPARRAAGIDPLKALREE
jgi:predicted permease